MPRKRRSFSAAEKAAAVRKHLVDKVPVSQIADQMKVQPTLIHNWVNAAMSQVERAFESPRTAKTDKSKSEREVTELREKLIAKNEVISELMEENIHSKKDNGGL
ncbi:transposase, partial [Roseimaritima sediminicola]|uniref:transposase n=1 Tax=Roseimaritima sediminicola TaxID=2662066 RepID=UPI001EEDB041